MSKKVLGGGEASVKGQAKMYRWRVGRQMGRG